ncbi:MAG: hypothetical protein HY821_07870 [Acidobacteria bacterium]|nr:hypothetical protein [Acidobacteriota bacterium]
MRLFISLIVLFCLTAVIPVVGQGCVKIQSGNLVDTKGNPISVGYDMYGYNYQAHIFNGLYENFSRPTPPVTSGTEKLVMKWSDDWLANVDCNGDGKLDRGLDPKTGKSDGTSKGWLTNHFEGDYLGSDGEYHHYTYFAKIVYVGPPPAAGPDPWAAVRIWGLYATIEEIQTDKFGEYGGRLKSDKLVAPGLGKY